jgi:hypothetical protein
MHWCRITVKVEGGFFKVKWDLENKSFVVEYSNLKKAKLQLAVKN